jgi:hypothetical protein
MPIEAKPLFRPDVLSMYLSSFPLSEQAQACVDRLARWAEMIGSGRIDAFKGGEVLPDFLSDIFCGVLGYSGPADAAAYTFSREQHIQVEGEFADAVLGRFGVDKPQFVAAAEGKASKDPRERPFGGRRLSAVGQAYRYAINLPVTGSLSRTSGRSASIIRAPTRGFTICSRPPDCFRRRHI